MSTYRKEWTCCGSVTETESFEPPFCPICQQTEAAEAVRAAERERSVQLWRHYAYAALGMHRDQMTPEDVAAVQRFLGPLEA